MNMVVEINLKKVSRFFRRKVVKNQFLSCWWIENVKTDLKSFLSVDFGFGFGFSFGFD